MSMCGGPQPKACAKAWWGRLGGAVPLCPCGWQQTGVEKALTALSVKTPWDVRPPPLPPGGISFAFL